MSNTSVKVKVAIALFGGVAAMGGSRPSAALGAQIGAAGMLANPSRVGNTAGVAALPPPRISVPAIPQFK